MMIDSDPERPGDAVGGDVIVGRPDATGGKNVGIAAAQRIQCGDDVGLFVGDNPHFLEVDPDIGEVFGDEADILVLGAPGQDFVADHQNARRDDFAHGLSSPTTGPLPTQGLEVTRQCFRNKHCHAVFSGNIADTPAKCFPIHAYRGGPTLATIPFGHALFGTASKNSQDIWQSRSTK